MEIAAQSVIKICGNEHDWQFHYDKKSDKIWLTNGLYHGDSSNLNINSIIECEADGSPRETT